jgi:hypothetical protein
VTRAPSDNRVAVSLFGASAISCVLFGLVVALGGRFGGGIGWSEALGIGVAYGLVAFVVGVGVALVAGLPLYYFLRNRVRARRRWAILTGALLAAIPYPGLIVISSLPLNVAGVNDLWRLAPFTLLLLLLGGIGGLIFWWMLTGSLRTQTSTADGIPGSPPSP